MKASGFLAVILLAVPLAAGETNTAPSPFESGAGPTPANRIDELVFARLKRLDIQPANICPDAVFVRRAYLDVIGTLPTGHEAREFILDKNPAKRSALI